MSRRTSLLCGRQAHAPSQGQQWGGSAHSWREGGEMIGGVEGDRERGREEGREGGRKRGRDV